MVVFFELYVYIWRRWQFFLNLIYISKLHNSYSDFPMYLTAFFFLIFTSRFFEGQDVQSCIYYFPSPYLALFPCSYFSECHGHFAFSYCNPILPKKLWNPSSSFLFQYCHSLSLGLILQTPVIVKFACQLDGAKGSQRAGKTLFFNVSEDVSGRD